VNRLPARLGEALCGGYWPAVGSLPAAGALANPDRAVVQPA
jgi:hypothetical protein